MKRSFILFGLLALTLLGLTSAVATTCSKDTQCSAGAYCIEGTGPALPQCNIIGWTTACNGTNISCVTGSDCWGIGAYACDINRGICTSNAYPGEACRIDLDCRSTTEQVCVSGVCSVIKGGAGTVVCGSDNDCAPYQYSGYPLACTNGYCREKGGLGAGCMRDAECGVAGGKNLICDPIHHVCEQCLTNQGTSPPGLPAGTFCDIQHKEICSLQKFYAPYSSTSPWSPPNELPVGLITPKLGEGESCIDSACCANNMDCVNGHCVGGGGLPIFGGNYSNEFCSNDSLGYSLSTHWFDNGVSLTTPPNVTVFRNFFGISDLYTIRFNVSGAFNCYQQIVFKRQSSVTQKNMSAVFYSNSTGELCYFRQISTNIFWDCVDAGTGKARSIYSNSIVLYPTTGINAGDSNLRIMISKNGVGAYYQQSVSILRASDTNSIDDVDIFTVSGGTPPDGFICGYNGAAYTGVRTSQFPGMCINDENLNCNGGTARNEWCYDKSYTFSGVQLNLRAGSYAILELTCSLVTATFGPSTTSFTTDSIDTQTISCCATTADCETLYGSGICCNSGSCGNCNIGTKTATLIPYSSDGQFASGLFCPSTNALFSVSIWGTIPIPGLPSIPNTPIYPTGTITVSVTGTGTVTPSSCNAATNPCTFNYHSGASGTDYINIDYSGNAEYGATSIRLKTTIQTACKWVKVLVYGKDTQVTIPYVSIHVLTNKPQTVTTDFQGYYSFGGLYPNIDLNLTLTKTGYDSISYSLDNATDFNKQVSLYMYPKTNVTNQPSNALITTPPTDVGEVTNGFLKIAFAFFAWPFTWILLIMTFLLGLIVVRHLLLGAMG